MSRLTGMIKGKCPKCGKGDLFEPRKFNLKTAVMKKQCDHCHYHFERESGFFWGAMYISYALTVLESAIIFLICQLFFDEPFANGIIWIIASSMLLLSLFNFRYSRIIWIYLFTPAAPQGAN